MFKAISTYSEVSEGDGGGVRQYCELIESGRERGKTDEREAHWSDTEEKNRYRFHGK